MTDENGGTRDGAPAAPNPVWVYGYEMIPPHHDELVMTIRRFLRRENSKAKKEDVNWTARLITAEQMTHVLIVSSDPHSDLELNQKLEAKLTALGIAFQPAVPMPIGETPQPVKP